MNKQEKIISRLKASDSIKDAKFKKGKDGKCIILYIEFVEKREEVFLDVDDFIQSEIKSSKAVIEFLEGLKA